jgi:hypothetical protein
MRNPIDMERAQGRAIIREIGERLREHLREKPELPESFKATIDLLRELEDYDRHR